MWYTVGGPSENHYSGVFLACVDCHLGPSLTNIVKSNQWNRLTRAIDMVNHQSVHSIPILSLSQYLQTEFEVFPFLPNTYSYRMNPKSSWSSIIFPIIWKLSQWYDNTPISTTWHLSPIISLCALQKCMAFGLCLLLMFSGQISELRRYTILRERNS